MNKQTIAIHLQPRQKALEFIFWISKSQ